jgi:YYY domain-containing protein
MEWIGYTLAWYVMLLIIGIIFFPMTRLIFGSFYDKGYGFSKALGIMFLSYSVYVLGTTHIIPFTQFTLFGVLAAWGCFNYYLHRKNALKESLPIHLLILEEALFFIALFFWAYIRGFEPSIRGLEKFMDFGFINSAMRGDYFPTKDMWLSGKSINYYYFGHLTGAVLTKLSFIPSFITYNLILAQLFAMSIVGTFTLGFNLAYHGFKKNIRLSLITGLLATFLTNLGGNLHTIYAFTMGYANENPAPLWETTAKYKLVDLLHPIQALDKLPLNYWYPNATRFIPFTIHEFPLYSYVVADLHGHVFDIPFVLMTIALLFNLFMHTKVHRLSLPKFSSQALVKYFSRELSFTRGYVGYALLLGFFISIHLMTNAFDAPIYLALTGIVLLSLFGISRELFIYGGIVVGSFVVFNLPFSSGFEPFATGLGFNCVPEGLASTARALIHGTPFESKFLFENNCQSSHWWMLATLWGFFWFNFIFFTLYVLSRKLALTRVQIFVLTIFAFSTLLIIAPEFVYAKDIYPSHFRANTMFKLGYQAFMMLSIASAFTCIMFKQTFRKMWLSKIYMGIFVVLFALVALYPAFAVDSYYGHKDKGPYLDGEVWIAGSTELAEYYDIIQYFNRSVEGQPIILEAQGDSYTDYGIVSAYTGLPTVAGWYVHQWLWRGTPDAVGNRQADIQGIYQDYDITKTRAALKKYGVEYVIVGPQERVKYPNTDESKFEALGKAVYRTKIGRGVVYQIPVDTY